MPRSASWSATSRTRAGPGGSGPLDVLETDFRSDAKGIALPYGIYDPTRNAGYVVIGVSHETAEFAVAAIRAWWLDVGQQAYPGQHHLLIQADDGGANDSRTGCGKPRCKPWPMNSS